jgi:hypothetical protein
MVETPSGFGEEFEKEWPNVGVLRPHDHCPYFGAIGSFDGEGKCSHFSPLPLLELEIKHKHGGFNINYEKATVVWQQFGFGS